MFQSPPEETAAAVEAALREGAEPGAMAWTRAAQRVCECRLPG